MATEQQLQHTRIQQAFDTMAHAANEKRLLVPAILWEVDPYSAATSAINKALDLALANDGAMSEGEREQLIKLVNCLRDIGERY